MIGHLGPDEQDWTSKQPWLESCGYQLRPRYQPDWIPSWIKDPPSHPIYGPWEREDFFGTKRAAIMDAVRIKDGSPVILKQIHKIGNRYDQEAEISLFLSSPELSNDSQNHCIPIYEMLEIPDDDQSAILVMPLLREFNSPRFDTIGECLDFFQQIFKARGGCFPLLFTKDVCVQGLEFIHRHHIAHRDCAGPNVMMDGSELYPNGFHPREPDLNREYTGPAQQMYTRTQRPPKYYWIDFGNSARFHPNDRSPKIIPLHGADKTVPEFQVPNYRQQNFNPFLTDIYYLGNLMRMHFTEGDTERSIPKIYGLDFLKPLIDDMVQANPDRRPTIDQCVVRLDDIIRNQSSWTLRSQVWHSNDHFLGIIYRLFPHWARRIIFIITQTPPIPHRE